jgi:phosphatidate cytidylyltransferase
VGELKKRLVASFCIAPFIASAFYFLPDTWFSIMLLLIALIAIFELASMSGTDERYVLLVLTVLCIIPLYFKLFFYYAGCLLFAPLIFLIYKIMKGESKKPGINEGILKGIFIFFIGEIFVIFPLYHLSLLKQTGLSVPFILLLTIWASDTCAYLLGKNFGKRRLVPLISPKKTYEGLFGAILGSTMIIMLSAKTMGIGLQEASIIGIIMGILAQAGDILESAGKRVCAAKDSSGLIPGHGGILDRMDSFMFTAPFLYHYLNGVKL